MKNQIKRIIGWLLFALLFNESEGLYNGRIRITSSSINIEYEHQIKDRTPGFTQNVDLTPFRQLKSTNCSASDAKFCLSLSNSAKFRINRIDDHCENYQYWTTLDKPISVEFDIANVHLYGADEITNQTWPRKISEEKSGAFVTREDNSVSILEPIWYTSTGFYVYVAPEVPLFVSYDASKPTLKLTARRAEPYIRGKTTHLKYKVCKYDDIKQAYKNAIKDTLGKPTGVPDYRMTALPLWSTWARYKTNINESAILELADQINLNKFPNSQLEIDDAWETCYGSLTVDSKKFPDMKRLVDKLHSQGYRVTVWIHPFVSVDCSPYYDLGVKNKYFIRRANGSTEGLWWNGRAAGIDFTNPDAVDWFLMRLQQLQDETGVDSFKFDAGETSWLPQPPIYHVMTGDHPDTFLREYVRAISSFGSMIEVRAARQTQQYPIFVRMQDRWSLWNGRLGLSTLIPELLHLNVIGYPFVLPDMVGGNGYDDTELTKELFIRWLQCGIFMPGLQFSYLPWEFDEETVRITQKYVDLHEKYAPKIYELMKKATETETMVNPPLWWIDPTDPVALEIGTEYLLGEDILVAPVLEKGATSRDIYFPRGIWRDETIKDSPLIHGPKWVYNYPASLEVLPHFSRVTHSSSAIIISPSLLLLVITLLLFLHK